MFPADGCVTPSAKPTATAASTALPPRRSTSRPTSVAFASALVTAPCSPSASDPGSSAAALPSLAADAPAATSRAGGVPIAGGSADRPLPVLPQPSATAASNATSSRSLSESWRRVPGARESVFTATDTAGSAPPPRELGADGPVLQPENRKELRGEIPWPLPREALLPRPRRRCGKRWPPNSGRPTPDEQLRTDNDEHAYRRTARRRSSGTGDRDAVTSKQKWLPHEPTKRCDRHRA